LYKVMKVWVCESRMWVVWMSEYEMGGESFREVFLL
jgi:hypothetical protein